MNRGSALRAISAGYLASYGFAVVGIPFLAIGLGATIDQRAGRDPREAVSGVGFVAFVFMFVMVFAVRLVFWNRVSADLQALVRAVLSLVLATELIAAVVALGMAPWQGAHGAGLATWFTVLGVICQIATLIWLVRYRPE